MELVLKRDRENKRENSTIGKLYTDDGTYLCDTLEDVEREGEKIYGKTAIPVGRYELRWSYSPKFKRYLPELLDVPNYTGVRIHSGNTHKDTEGCPLVGEYDGGDMVINSVKTFNRIEQTLSVATHINIM